MREALHVIEGVVERLPATVTNEEVSNFKMLANKGIYQCPYCDANLQVKHGDERGTYFSHLHSEACEESRIADEAEKRYSKQIARESKKHRAIIDIIYDELKISSKINANVEVDYGYRAKIDLKFFPDIHLKIGRSELAISVVTNVQYKDDVSLSKAIEKRHSYFIKHGMKPIWFIENKELSVERDKNAIVLWDSEAVTAITTDEDIKWQNAIKTVANDLSFFKVFKYTPFMSTWNIDIGSLYYITSNETNITVSVRRFIKDREQKPYRGFMLGESYEIPFSKALVIKDESLKLSDDVIEEQNRNKFINNYFSLLKEKKEEEIRIREEEERRERENKETQARKRQQLIEERKMVTAKQVEKPMAYTELTKLLKERIGLTQKEQMELWTKFILRKIGPKNCKKVWDIVEENNITSFDELREHLLQLSK